MLAAPLLGFTRDLQPQYGHFYDHAKGALEARWDETKDILLSEHVRQASAWMVCMSDELARRQRVTPGPP